MSKYYKINTTHGIYFYEYEAGRCIRQFSKNETEIRIIKFVKPMNWPIDGLKEIRKADFFKAYKSGMKSAELDNISTSGS